MAWYRTGTISVTNGSATVTGSGTAFVANAREGYGLVGPDGRTYEVATVVSNTQLTLAGNYQGATASGQSYAIFPTQSVIADLATQAASLITSFATVRDGVGAGLHPSGTISVPAIRFAADQDTGFYRPASNQVGVVAGAAEIMRLSSSAVAIGTPSFTGKFAISSINSHLVLVNASAPTDEKHWYIDSSGANFRIMARDDAGSVFTAALTLQRLGTTITNFVVRGNLLPATDNAQGLGSGPQRWAVVYAGTGAINTSDADEKTWRGALTQDEYEAGLEVLDELGFYQWNDAIAEKGPDGARYHFGVRAQQVWSIFAQHELVDPIVDGKPGETPYSFLCFDKWDEQSEPIVGEDGEPTGQTKIVLEAGSRFGVRYNDLTLFLLAVQARRQSEIEARLEALEA